MPMGHQVPPGGPRGARDCVRATSRGSDQRWEELLRDQEVHGPCHCSAVSFSPQAWLPHSPPRTPPPQPSVLGAGLGLFPCGSQAGLGSGAALLPSRRLQEPKKEPGVTAGSRAEAPARTLPCIPSSTAFHCRSLRRLPHAPGGPAGPGQQRAAGSAQLRGRWRWSPDPRSLLLLTEEPHAARGPGWTHLGSLFPAIVLRGLCSGQVHGSGLMGGSGRMRREL